ncbi:phage transcriptional regulator, ArpU family [Terribacillus aidingensis]|uniref:Phage transcriptional regulator, ArpU family n=1 Tax=Terribacillus aidingensis TaxID=586416 RepID=A0A285NYI8_9BACI|nr:ArpU family phage packaging/lysis transcriptional regulator [Terribacillus aidingensis]SNZ14509.1 phage transcriptional regulator, ArpU family [Terribacillus aidingensis]
MEFELPELDRKATQREVEAALERYRIYNYLTYEEKEATTTASYDDVGGGRANTISDQTGNIATQNVDEVAKRKKYCERVIRSVNKMPKMERFLIEKRYLSREADYITDAKVYSFEFQPPISHVTYGKLRWKAFYKLALDLNIAVTKSNETS